jgi:hypothetical protein
MSHAPTWQQETETHLPWLTALALGLTSSLSGYFHETLITWTMTFQALVQFAQIASRNETECNLKNSS